MKKLVDPIETTKEPYSTKTGMKKKSLRKYITIVLILLVLVLGGMVIYLYKHQDSATAQSQASLKEAKSLAEKVGKHIVLPNDEIPTVATVSDPDALKDQSFFVDAKKGDKVLIYSNAKKAILYDPVQDRVVTIAPLTTDTAQKNVAPAPTISSPEPAKTNKK